MGQTGAFLWINSWQEAHVFIGGFCCRRMCCLTSVIVIKDPGSLGKSLEYIVGTYGSCEDEWAMAGAGDGSCLQPLGLLNEKRIQNFL